MASISGAPGDGMLCAVAGDNRKCNVAAKRRVETWRPGYAGEAVPWHFWHFHQYNNHHLRRGIDWRNMSMHQHVGSTARPKRDRSAAAMAALAWLPNGGPMAHAWHKITRRGRDIRKWPAVCRAAHGMPGTNDVEAYW